MTIALTDIERKQLRYLVAESVMESRGSLKFIDDENPGEDYFRELAELETKLSILMKLQG